MLHVLQNLTDISNAEQMGNLDISCFGDLPFHIYWKDRTGKYLGCNEAQAKNIGLNEKAEIIGQSDFDFPWNKAASQLKKNDSAVIVNEKPIIFLEPVSLIDGKEKIAISHKAPLRTRSKKIIGIVGVSLIINKEEASFLNPNSLKLVPPSKSIELPALTARQVDCLFYLTKGMTLKQIAKTLNLSPRTIEHYLEAVKIKLNCETRSELIAKALQLNVIKNRLLFD